MWGTADTAWVYQGPWGSYGYNGACYSSVVTNGPVIEPAPTYRKLSDLTCPSRTPYFGDCNWVGGFPVWANSSFSTSLPHDLYTGEPLGAGRTMGRYLIARHGINGPASAAPRAFVGSQNQLPGRNNFGYADGHVEGTFLKNLWTLRWREEPGWP